MPYALITMTVAVDALGLERGEQVEPAHLGHAHVGEDDVGPEGLDQGERLLAGGGDLDLVALPLEEGAHHQPEVLFVVDDQDAAHGGSSQLFLTPGGAATQRVADPCGVPRRGRSTCEPGSLLRRVVRGKRAQSRKWAWTGRAVDAGAPGCHCALVQRSPMSLRDRLVERGKKIASSGVVRAPHQQRPGDGGRDRRHGRPEPVLGGARAGRRGAEHPPQGARAAQHRPGARGRGRRDRRARDGAARTQQRGGRERQGARRRPQAAVPRRSAHGAARSPRCGRGDRRAHGRRAEARRARWRRARRCRASAGATCSRSASSS